MRKPLLLATLSLVPLAASAQVPSTDIHLFEIERAADGSITLHATANATASPGYDNQPAFAPDSESFLFTSMRLGDQTEVFRYDIPTGTTTRVTDTPESEYSPTPLPGGGFSTVRVETDSTGTQRLWEFDAEGTHPTLVLEDVRGIGYHAWVNSDELFLFILGEPHELHHADRRTGQSERVGQDIGRAIHKIPGHDAVSFTQPLDDDHWQIRRIEVESGEITDVAPAVGTSQDLTWTPDGHLWMTDGSRIVQWSMDEWIEIGDLAAHGVAGLTRLAVSPDGRWLAVVAAEPAAEGE